MELPPKVSIVIPVFNGANYLGQAIDSALSQTYKNIEIIVVNDGSSDEEQTEKVALSYGKKIRYYQKENGGVATALNLGIQQMEGTYFSWLSHDDLYSPDKIESQIDLFKKADNKNVVLFCDSESIDEDGTYIKTVVTNKKYINNAVLLILSTSLHGCSLLIPKAAFQKVGLFNESLRNSQDNEMWVRLAMAGYKFQYVPEVLVKGRVHRHQTTRTSMKRHVGESKDFFQWALDIISPEILLANKREILEILFKKNQPTAIHHFITILRDNNEMVSFYPVLALGFLAILKSNISSRINAIPGYISMRHAIRQRLTRTPTTHK